jgi:hypothetical protein
MMSFHAAHGRHGDLRNRYRVRTIKDDQIQGSVEAFRVRRMPEEHDCTVGD